VANLSDLETAGAEHFHRFLMGVPHVIFRPPIYCVIIVNTIIIIIWPSRLEVILDTAAWMGIGCGILSI